MSFTKELRQKADHIFEGIFEHPFVRGLAQGELSKEQLAHYVKQDFQYLTVFCQMYGLAMSKCTTREDIAFFHDKTGFILNSELHPHHNLAQVSGYPMNELESETVLMPAAHHYTRHMLYVAHQGSLGELLCALLPCPYTYWEIGLKLKDEIKGVDNHPFRVWIEFYAERASGEISQGFLHKVDGIAAQASQDELIKMEQHFMDSCRLEYMFWDMAYNLQKWPL